MNNDDLYKLIVDNEMENVKKLANNIQVFLNPDLDNEH